MKCTRVFLVKSCIQVDAKLHSQPGLVEGAGHLIYDSILFVKVFDAFEICLD